jgi:phosphoribosylformylglycinamidine synthase
LERLSAAGVAAMARAGTHAVLLPTTAHLLRLPPPPARALIDAGLLSSCHDISDGGLGISLAECCFKDYEAPLGAKLTLSSSSGRPDGLLFSESGARFIVSCSPENASAVKAKLSALGLSVGGEGTVGGSTIKVEGVAEIDVAKGFEAWFKGLEQIFEA